MFENVKQDRNPEELGISYPTEVLPPSEADEENYSGRRCDFEEAVEATGYGRYNILLMLASLPGGMANSFDTSAMSYILPAAECDLKLSVFHKGVLNAITFTGMMTSGLIWGYLADTKGRRSLLKYGYLADTICTILSSVSRSFYVLVIFKFFNGFIINGPFAINMTYVAEFHSSKHRSKTMLWTNLYLPAGYALVPILAWTIIPQTWSLSFFGGAFVYNSWRMFILATATPAFLGLLATLFFPESPKFLMSQGRNDEAMEVFKKMYAMNTGNPPETFPVKALLLETAERQIQHSTDRKDASLWDNIRNGLVQFKPLLVKPYVYRFFLMVIIQIGSISSSTTLRLWMPQLFTYIENFDYKNHDARGLGSPTLCEMISVRDSINISTNNRANTTVVDTCVPTLIHDTVYINSIIISCASVIASTLAGSLVHLIGRKLLLLTIYLISAACACGIIWSSDSFVIPAILLVFLTLACLSVTIVISYVVDLMPTSLRTMAVSLNLCFGRSGAMVGNLLFPILLGIGCMGPFLFIAGLLICSFVLTIFIPKPPPKLM